MSTNIYILRLEGGRYYVGKSDNPQKRFQEHVAGKGAAWTKKYKPIALEKVIPNASDFDEDKHTKELMAKHGIDKVRGGTYVEIELDEVQEYSLQKEIWGAKNKCKTCGRDGHFAKDCYAKTDVDCHTLHSETDSDLYTWVCDHCDKEFSDEEDCERHEKYCKSKKTQVVCFKCKRSGHYSNNCYATTDKYGNWLD